MFFCMHHPHPAALTLTRSSSPIHCQINNATVGERKIKKLAEAIRPSIAPTDPVITAKVNSSSARESTFRTALLSLAHLLFPPLPRNDTTAFGWTLLQPLILSPLSVVIKNDPQELSSSSLDGPWNGVYAKLMAVHYYQNTFQFMCLRWARLIVLSCPQRDDCGDERAEMMAACKAHSQPT